jgi:hypothetical protein
MRPGDCRAHKASLPNSTGIALSRKSNVLLVRRIRIDPHVPPTPRICRPNGYLLSRSGIDHEKIADFA